MDKPVLKYVDAICGSGKSHSLKEHILAGDKRDKRYLLAMPTLELCEQFKEDLARLGIEAITVSSESSSATTSLKYALYPDNFPRHIICTHEAFKHYCYLAMHNKEMQELLSGVDVFIDEIPSASFGGYIKVDSKSRVDDNYPFLDWLEERNGLWWIKEDNRDEFLAYWKEKNANSKDLKQMLWAMLAGAGMSLDTEKHFFAYTATPITYASLWASEFVVMGAGVSRSEYVFWAENMLKADVTSAPESLYPDETRRVYPNKKVTLVSLMQSNASFTSLEHTFTNHIKEVRERVAGEKFIYATNKDKNTAYVQCDFSQIGERELGEKGGEMVSMASYGLNHYQHFNNAVFLGCSNDNRDVSGKWANYCELNGWDWELVKEKRKAARNYEQAYQFVSRCGIRNFDSKAPQLYIVPDAATAEYLKEHYFPNAKIDCMNLDVPKKPRKEKSTDKGDNTRAQVQALKLQGYKQKHVAEKLGKSKGLISQLWK